MFKCLECGKRFEEPDRKYETYEHYYGCPNIGSSTPFWLNVCPICGSEEFEEEVDEDE